ncbi:MAG: carbamoyltransferase HypF [Dehalococcoidales bacterium]|nr:MAG: carbamoyltransferase HypF [Dehalococcoidales bacterium]
MTEVIKRELACINVRGVVQGVGFRPFVYQLAVKHNLTGRVSNTSEDVRIEVEGKSDSIERFLADISILAPPRSVIENISVSKHPAAGYQEFVIQESIAEEGKYQLISPDIATCPDCLAEIFDPSNRRYRYPFTNCTNCGPRFTIIEDIPYDRPFTTMKDFTMCPDCRKEYEDPLNRRFHAQPNACPVCGPSLVLLDNTGNQIDTDEVIIASANLLKQDNIIAVKGLGGFLLACDACSENVVNLLRERKHRPFKPFAVMMSSMKEVKSHCEITTEEEKLITSPNSPIVLVKWKLKSNIAKAVAPNIGYLGVMLPYTPLHHLLMRETGLPLVMTSGNISEEPIAKDNDEALRRLSGIADYYLVHNRDIYARYDDSVMIVEDETPQLLRRARGYAPYPVKLKNRVPETLGCGAELKNTFCLTRDEYAFISQHIGDMENLETLEHYENTVSLYKNLFRIEPKIIAYDMHPDYLATKYAIEQSDNNPGLKPVAVQHHHAHIAACMADNDINTPVIGVTFDGTGYGTDGKIWGGEFLVADYNDFRRMVHFEYLPLPGGEAAIKNPYRITAGYLVALMGEDVLQQELPFRKHMTEEQVRMIVEQVKKNINAPLTSSCGRLFDAVSSLLGIRGEVSYEAQAAIEMEMLAYDEPDESGVYPYSYTDNQEGLRIIRLGDLFSAILTDLHSDTTQAKIAVRFHNTVAAITNNLCKVISDDTGIRDIALSGGVFQNRLLLRKTVEMLKVSGFRVLTHRQVPTNDGGISLGQVVVAGQYR